MKTIAMSRNKDIHDDVAHICGGMRSSSGVL